MVEGMKRVRVSKKMHYDGKERDSPVCVLEVDIHFLRRTEELWNTNKVEH